MSYKIISKFIKDISFEIPNTQTFIMMEKEILNYNLNCDIKSKPYKENIIEVNTILRLTPNQDVKHKMLTEINLTALVSVDKNFQKKEELERIILIKVPAEIYPTLYDTFVYLFTQAGVKNISITKEVDFEKVKLPATVERFLNKFVESMKDANLNRIRRSAILYKVINASGMSPQQLMADIQKIKQAMK